MGRPRTGPLLAGRCPTHREGDVHIGPSPHITLHVGWPSGGGPSGSSWPGVLWSLRPWHWHPYPQGSALLHWVHLELFPAIGQVCT